MTSKTHRTGFSLIELLVVVSIIGMLAALLNPMIQTSLAHAKAAKCVSNLRQVGTAVQQYVADPANNNQFPPIFDMEQGSLAPLAALSNYGVTLGLLSCPADRSPDTNYGSYIWSAIPDSEDAAAVKRIGRGGRAVILNKLSRLQLATDGSYGNPPGFPHPGRSFNTLWADGHVDSTMTSTN